MTACETSNHRIAAWPVKKQQRQLAHALQGTIFWDQPTTGLHINAYQSIQHGDREPQNSQAAKARRLIAACVSRGMRAETFSARACSHISAMTLGHGRDSSLNMHSTSSCPARPLSFHWRAGRNQINHAVARRESVMPEAKQASKSGLPAFRPKPWHHTNTPGQRMPQSPKQRRRGEKKETTHTSTHACYAQIENCWGGAGTINVRQQQAKQRICAQHGNTHATSPALLLASTLAGQPTPLPTQTFTAVTSQLLFHKPAPSRSTAAAAACADAVARNVTVKHRSP